MKGDTKSGVCKPKNNSSGSNCKKVMPEDDPKVETGEECHTDEQAFLVSLYKYMKERKTPIERIPYLGFKQSKYSFFTSSSITKLWKSQALHKSTTWTNSVTSTKWMAFEKIKNVSKESFSQKKKKKNKMQILLSIKHDLLSSVKHKSIS